MPDSAALLQELRRKIRQTGRQFRQNNDNSDSIFHPEGGFQYAYDIAEVEAALDKYEEGLPTQFNPDKREITMEDQIIETARVICTEHKSMEIRDFARNVLAYFAIHHSQQARSKPAKLKRVD